MRPAERAVANLKHWRILFTDYRRPLKTFKSSFRAATRLYFFKESLHSPLCSRYGEMMNLTRVNDYLWENGAAPVDVGDVEVMGITASCTSYFGADEVTGRWWMDSTPSDISFIPFDLGREMRKRSARPFDK